MLRRIHRHIRHAHRGLTGLSQVTQSTVDHLRTHGYAVQDDILTRAECALLRSEISSLIDSGATQANETHIISRSGTTTYKKSGVQQAELHTLPETHLSTTPTLRTLRDDVSLASLISVLWPRLTLREQGVKVQRAVDGCFPVHVDSAAGHDGRVVTGLLYPHEGWGGDGGALRVYDTPLTHVDIAPVGGRLVLLSSRGMHHRVLPAGRERYVVTLWLSGSMRKMAVPRVELRSVEGKVAYELLDVGLRDLGMRLVVREEWVKSLRESHDDVVGEELVKGFERGFEGLSGVVKRVVARRGLEVEESEVEKIVACRDRLKRGFEEVERVCGGVPFFW